MPTEAEKPNTEQERARYVGKVAVYAFCVSAVAMPSSSWYKLEVSLGPLLLAFDVVLLKNLMEVGIVVKSTNIKTVKPAMEEALLECSIRDPDMTRRCWWCVAREHKSTL